MSLTPATGKNAVPSPTVLDPARGVQGALGRFFQNDWAWALSLFLVALGAKFFLISHFGSPLPYWDQWDGEAADIYIPYYSGHLTLADLFRAHNEHRIFFTRLCDLVLLMLNRQWDNQLQMVVNAVIHAAGLAGFGVIMARLMGRANWPFIWLALALALVLPLGWENTLSGFQSQFYFLLIFSLLTIRWLGLSEPLSARWFFGIGTGVAALFTTASGFVAALAVASVVFIQVFKQRDNWRRYLPTLAVCAALTIAGLLLKQDVPFHQALQAQSLGDFLLSLERNLAWPWIDQPWCALINLFPITLLAWIYFRSSDKPRLAEPMILGVAAWVILQSMAAAYARGANGGAPVSRYMDSASFFMIANCLSAILLFTDYRQQLWAASFRPAGLAVWALVCLGGLWTSTDSVWHETLTPVKLTRETALANTRAFLATNDPAIFLNANVYFRPFPYVDKLVDMLRNPAVRRILPACARSPLTVAGKPGNDSAFVTNGWDLAEPGSTIDKSWGCYSQKGSAARGEFESLPIRQSALPFLEIPIAGQLGDAGLSLELVDIASGKATPVRTFPQEYGKWRNVYVKSPPGDFKILAHDDSETKWFAFKAPREVGRFSYWAMQIVAAWKYFLVAGMAFLFLSLAGMLAGFSTLPPKSR